MLTLENIENRKKGIGASEVGIVMGFSSFMSPYELWRVKTGRDAAPDLSDISKYPQVYWGNMHEDNIADHYAKTQNRKVRRVTNTIFSKVYPYMLCHLDRKIEGLPWVLECKFAMFAKDVWGNPAIDNEKDIVPMMYMLQMQYQLYITGYQEADLAVLIGGYDFRVYHFKRDEAIIAKIVAEVKAFWKCVEDDVAPPLTNRYDAQLAYPDCLGTAIEADTNIVEAVVKFRDIRSRAKQLEEDRAKLEGILAIFIKDAEVLKSQGDVLATLKLTKKGTKQLLVKEARS